MPLFITSINSGSNGNCYYVGNGKEALLFDVGISCRETERRLKRLNLDIQKLKAIFVSHEHTDHIRGIQMLARKYNLPVYITHKTLDRSRLKLNQPIPFTNKSSLAIGELEVKAFFKHHDAEDPHSFTVTYDGITVGIFTDIGQVCENLISHFQECDAAFLEANYDNDLLINGRYPIYLKNRIRGGLGHLSNQQAFDLFKAYKSKKLSHLILSHLSKENNRPELVKKLFEQCAGTTQIIVASRYEESEVFEIKIGNDALKRNQYNAQAKQTLLF